MSGTLACKCRQASLVAMLLVGAPAPSAFAESEADVLKRAFITQTQRIQALEEGRRSDFEIRVNPGTEQDAKDYYKAIATLIKFDTLPASDLNGFLVYLGFEGLKAADLELLPSAVLMPKSKSDFDTLASQVSDPTAFKSKRSLDDFAHDRVLVSRFFAPKIVNYNLKPNPECPVAKPDCKQNPYNAGWRKLVRLVPLAKSDAEKGNIREAYILFNYVQPDVEKSPFPIKVADLKPKTESVNNQVILVPKTRNPKTDDAVYWMVYQPSSKDYKLGHALNAAFDSIETDGGTKDYFVPMACAQCHGHDEFSSGADPIKRPFLFGKTNYLDTDQWYDMVDFDFPGTKNSKFEADVVFDGGRDHTTKKYAAAIDVIAKLNEYIRKQNEESLRPKSDPFPDGFKVLAVKKWLALHKADPKPVKSLFKRSIGSKSWDEKKVLDAKLLPQLDRFCFRCHSTVRFDVFDREAVKVKAKNGVASTYVNTKFMPQGRTLSDPQRTELAKLLDELGAEK